MRTRIAIAIATVSACSADRPSTNKPDAAVMMETVDMPSIDPSVPMSTPNGTVAIRGTTNGSRIVVKGGPGDPVVRASLPNGAFCVDAPLVSGMPTMYSVFALKDGLVSQATLITVTEDSAAPIPSNAVCAGMEMPVCTPEDGAHNDCGDGKDNDCNGQIDMCDTGCNGCVDDALEPNNSPFFVPMVAAGTYNLQLCPCTSDWFSFTVAQGAIIHVKADFNTSLVDIDMMLQTPDVAQANGSAYVAISETTTNTEEIMYTAAASGTYYLKLYPYDPSKSGAYTLTIY